MGSLDTKREMNCGLGASAARCKWKNAEERDRQKGGKDARVEPNRFRAHHSGHGPAAPSGARTWQTHSVSHRSTVQDPHKSSHAFSLAHTATVVPAAQDGPEGADGFARSYGATWEQHMTEGSDVYGTGQDQHSHTGARSRWPILDTKTDRRRCELVRSVVRPLRNAKRDQRVREPHPPLSTGARGWSGSRMAWLVPPLSMDGAGGEERASSPFCQYVRSAAP